MTRAVAPEDEGGKGLDPEDAIIYATHAAKMPAREFVRFLMQPLPEDGVHSFREPWFDTAGCGTALAILGAAAGTAGIAGGLTYFFTQHTSAPEPADQSRALLAGYTPAQLAAFEFARAEGTEGLGMSTEEAHAWVASVSDEKDLAAYVERAKAELKNIAELMSAEELDLAAKRRIALAFAKRDAHPGKKR